MKYQLHPYVCECGAEIEMRVYPPRPMPICSNPSSPLFSDSGDPAEIDGSHECPECGAEIDHDAILENIEFDAVPDEDYRERWEEQV